MRPLAERTISSLGDLHIVTDRTSSDAVIEATVIVAFEHGLQNLSAVMRSLAPTKWPRVEFLLCSADPDAVAMLRGVSAENVRVLQSAEGARIPELWRDGIVAARGPRLGVLSAHCVPDENWVAAMLAAPLDDRCVGVGGFLSNAPDSDAAGWAIYLLRYVAYSRPRDAARAGNIAADNAVYSRTAVLACADLLPRGFWEPEFHRRFFAAGCHLQLSAALGAQHRNEYTPRQFVRQRYDHGRQFGAERRRRLGWIRVAALILLSPAIPFVLYSKVIARCWRSGWLFQVPPSAYGWLAVFAVAWGAGELRGLMRPDHEENIT